MKRGIIIATAILLMVLPTSKGKSNEEKIRELEKKLENAKTEKEVEIYANEIERIEQEKKESAKTITIKLGEPFTLWQNRQGPGEPEKKSEFRVTFKDPLIDKFLPYEAKFVEYFKGQKTPTKRTPADQGKKYFGIIVKIENLGPRESSLEQEIELKVDKGFIYRLGGNLVDNPEEDFPRNIFTLEPSKIGWLRLWCQIPDNANPIEISGKLGEGHFGAPGYTKFSMKLNKLGESVTKTETQISDSPEKLKEGKKTGFFQRLFRPWWSKNKDENKEIPPQQKQVDKVPDSSSNLTESDKTSRTLPATSESSKSKDVIKNQTETTKESSIGETWKQNEQKLQNTTATVPQFEKLTPEDEAEANRLWGEVLDQRVKMRLPSRDSASGNQMVKKCRDIISRWPQSEYAFKAKRALADLSDEQRKMYNITNEEITISDQSQELRNLERERIRRSILKRPTRDSGGDSGIIRPIRPIYTPVDTNMSKNENTIHPDGKILIKLLDPEKDTVAVGRENKIVPLVKDENLIKKGFEIMQKIVDALPEPTKQRIGEWRFGVIPGKDSYGDGKNAIVIGEEVLKKYSHDAISYVISHEIAHCTLEHKLELLKLSPMERIVATPSFPDQKLFREQELAADKFGTIYMLRACFKIDGAIEFISNMGMASEISGHIPWADSPAPSEKLAVVKEQANSLTASAVQITSNLQILPYSASYNIGESITANFTIKNVGGNCISFDVLTVGGRLNGECPDGQCPDFEFAQDISLAAGQSYTYNGRLRLLRSGKYHFFPTYKTKDSIWNTSIPAAPSVINTKDIMVDWKQNPNAEQQSNKKEEAAKQVINTVLDQLLKKQK